MDDRHERGVVMDCTPRIDYRAECRDVPTPLRQYRQGDVLLIESRPPGANRKLEQPIGGRWILALGEATGHAHAIAQIAGACLYRTGATRFLDALRPVELVHEEHGAITIEPGTYRVRIQREYVPPEPSSSTSSRAWAVGSVRPVRD